MTYTSVIVNLRVFAERCRSLRNERVFRARDFTGEVFWPRGYFVSTVGLDEDMVRGYVRHQENADERYDQMKLCV